MSQYSVLIVEDNPTDSTVMRSIAISSGWHVASAGTIEKALLQLEGATYDLVILDLHLPDSNGMATLARLRDVHRGQFLVVSGHLDGGVDDALAVAQVPHLSKRNGWQDELTTELQTFGAKGGMPARREDSDSDGDNCDGSWRKSVTRMFAAVQDGQKILREEFASLRQELTGDVTTIKRQVFGFRDEQTGRLVPGCADICDQIRVMRTGATGIGLKIAAGAAIAIGSSIGTILWQRLANG